MSATIAVIPARGGSKRIPRKNVRLFAGKPMIAWSIEAALESGAFDEVIVSTDDEEIAGTSVKFGAKVPFFRPEALSGDAAPLMPVLRLHAEAHGRTGQTAARIFCIYATAPFVVAPRLREAVNLLRESEVEFVLAVTPFEYPVQRALRLEAGRELKFVEPRFALTHSQHLEPRYHDAGQFFGGTYAAVMQHDTVMFARCLPIIVPLGEAVDIDTPEDWRFAESLFALQQNSARAHVLRVSSESAQKPS